MKPNSQEALKSLAQIMQKHGWTNDDLCSAEDLEKRFDIIREEAPEVYVVLMEKMRGQMEPING